MLKCHVLSKTLWNKGFDTKKRQLFEDTNKVQEKWKQQKSDIFNGLLSGVSSERVVFKKHFFVLKLFSNLGNLD